MKYLLTMMVLSCLTLILAGCGGSNDNKATLPDNPVTKINPPVAGGVGGPAGEENKKAKSAAAN